MFRHPIAIDQTDIEYYNCPGFTFWLWSSPEVRPPLRWIALPGNAKSS